jgi:hypothetical protein
VFHPLATQRAPGYDHRSSCTSGRVFDLARTIRFAIPTEVARALPVWDLSARARIDGELGPRLEYFEYRYPRREVVLTCAAPMAHFVLRQLHTLADRAAMQDEISLAAATAAAISAAQRAIAAPQEGTRSLSPRVP